MSELKSLLAERKAIEADLEKFDGMLNDWTHDLIVGRIEMLDSMIEIESYNA
jgi:hypothetical protein